MELQPSLRLAATETTDFVAPDPEQKARGIALRNRVSEVLPTIAANAREAEQLRMLPEENVRLLTETGLYRAMQPKKYGGLEISPEEYCPILVDLAGACASTAWVSGLYVQHGHGIALMSPKLQDEVWGENPDAVSSSSVAPLGKVEKVDGGVLLSGNFGWSSGCDHAQWAFLGFKYPDPVMDGFETPHLAVVPRADYEIVDDWHVAGLRGTGSKTLRVEKVFVPDHRFDSMVALNIGMSKGYGSNESWIYNAAWTHYFSFGFSAVSLGIALKFLDEYRTKISGRVRAYTGGQVAESAPAYTRLAESTHQVRAAYASLTKDWQEISSRSRSGQLPTNDEYVTWRANQAYVTKLAIESVDRLFTASGGSVWFDDKVIQRLWRDSKMTGAHAYSDYDVATLKHGQHLMGLPMDPTIY